MYSGILIGHLKPLGPTEVIIKMPECGVQYCHQGSVMYSLQLPGKMRHTNMADNKSPSGKHVKIPLSIAC